MKELNELTDKFTITSLELANVVGQKHNKVLTRLENLAESISGLSESSYIGDDGAKTKMYILDYLTVVEFFKTSRMENAPELLLQIFYKTLIENQSTQLKLANNRERVLNNHLAITARGLMKRSSNPRASASRDKHDLLMAWVDEVWLTYEVVQVSRYKYTITEEGKKHLYKTETGAIEVKCEPFEGNI